MMHGILKWLISFILPVRFGHEASSADAQVTYVSVLAGGKILLNGKTATLEGVKQALERTKVGKAQVWYYRESGGGEPPPEAVELFKFMVEKKLPIRLSSKADFSDSLDHEGRSQPVP